MFDRAKNRPVDLKLFIFNDLTISRRIANHEICIANQWTGYYMIGTSVMKELESSSQYSNWVNIPSEA